MCNFSSSVASSLVTAELPMLALIFVRAAIPMAIGSRLFVRCTRLAGITMRPRPTSERMSSSGRSSRCATNFISGVIWPLLACSNCVMKETPAGMMAVRLIHTIAKVGDRVPIASGRAAIPRHATANAPVAVRKSDSTLKRLVCKRSYRVLRYSSSAAFSSSSRASGKSWPAALLPGFEVSK